ncbi:MAG TPA: glycoside hydrolase family 2 TIM barrel-domain containing protein [Solirubrobacteraceae bacterium]|nr:glycoside hydrolase family 2 TIM barrel-domain containing protein [Solirubrobacteraceae bacterium]
MRRARAVAALCTVAVALGLATALAPALGAAADEPAPARAPAAEPALAPALGAAADAPPPQGPSQVPARAAAPQSPAAEPAPARIGGWTYRADPDDVGLRDDWATDPPTMTAVDVPGVANASPLAGARGRRAYEGTIGWWRGVLAVKPAGRYEVRFGSVHHRAMVWIDGRRACEHTGAYEPFACAARLDEGLHSVTLRADWRSPWRQQRDGHDRAWWSWGGLAWPVTAAPVANVALRLAGVHTTLDGDGDGDGDGATVTVGVDVTDNRASGKPARVIVAGTLTAPGGSTLQVTFAPIALAPGRKRRIEARVAVARPALWGPGHPALYDLTLGAGRGAAPLRQAVGLRELRRAGRRLLLNGRVLRVAGAGLPPDAEGHGDALTDADHDRIVAELRAIGANAVRSQLPLSNELLSRLDAAGILVWQQIGPFDKAGRFWAQTPRRRALAVARALRTADREAAHPSILAWNLVNEVSGQGHPRGQARYVDSLARRLQARTPGIFVVADVWGTHVPRWSGLLYSHLDAVGVTEYIGNAEGAGAPVRELDARVRTMLRRVRGVLPSKPIVITEFGANGNGRNSPGQPGSLGYQSNLLSRRIGFYARGDDVAGMLIWVLRDYAVTPGFRGGSLRGKVPGLVLSGPFNEKGLFRYDGSAKPAVAAVRTAFARARDGG